VPRILAENSDEKMHRPLRMMSFPLEMDVKDTYSALEHPEIGDRNGLGVDHDLKPWVKF